jgi:hypothetical protein
MTASDDIFAAVGQVPGWLAPEALYLTAELFGFQTHLGVPGDVLEFGVFRGKYLAFLCAISQAASLKVVGVDAFFQHNGVFLTPQWRDDAIAAIKANIAKVCEPALERTEIIAALTQDVSAARLSELCPAGLRFVSVDAGHGAAEVAADIELVAPLVVPGGVVAMDDVFNPVVPGVAEGVCRYFIKSQDRPDRLAPFATCGNKLFATTESHHAKFYHFCQNYIVNGPQLEFLNDSRVKLDANTKNRFYPEFFGWPIATF